ncbi:hypothetical protein RF11_15697 [Thelohanellus kitauei]|uniref:Uncharacterized protein n=1 Tax=Thelohanellus kitauei TaxID=669202 RepID=A0A0C2MRR0_THEKT|nr:hypothetical protein RF11_15697 [Thelohanellus kitauei]
MSTTNSIPLHQQLNYEQRSQSNLADYYNSQIEGYYPPTNQFTSSNPQPEYYFFYISAPDNIPTLHPEYSKTGILISELAPAHISSDQWVTSPHETNIIIYPQIYPTNPSVSQNKESYEICRVEDATMENSKMNIQYVAENNEFAPNSNNFMSANQGMVCHRCRKIFQRTDNSFSVCPVCHEELEKKNPTINVDQDPKNSGKGVSKKETDTLSHLNRVSPQK